ncbi:MAG: hypothetical protein AAF661_00610 [Pseudomonadota bacterium]
MTRDFKTAAEARAERLAEADGVVERVKRAVESALASYHEGTRERREAMVFCRDIGLELKISSAAGLEFVDSDAEMLAAKIAVTPMPASLQRFHRG